MKKNKTKSNSGIWLYMYFFFILYGPKIGTYIDTSILVGLIGIGISSGSGEARVNKKYTGYIFSLYLIILYVLFISLVNGNFDVVLFGRYIRSAVSLCSIWFVIRKSNTNVEKLQTSLISILLLHSVTVILTGLINIEWQHTISWFTGYTKKLHMYRSTGLMMGFDMAGLLCNLGLVLNFTMPNNKNKLQRPLYGIIFITATSLTSRFSMITMLLCLILFLVYYRKDNTKKIEKVICIFSIIIGSIPVILLTMSTTNVGLSMLPNLTYRFPKIMEIVNKVINSYNDTNLGDTVSNHFNFSELTFIQVVFGSGKYGGGDPGYTRMIFSVGIFGLVMVSIWYIKIISDLYRQNRYMKNSELNRQYEQVVLIVTIMFLLMIILDFKNNYFFTGTYFEIFIIEVTLAYKMLENVKFKEIIV